MLQPESSTAQGADAPQKAPLFSFLSAFLSTYASNVVKEETPEQPGGYKLLASGIKWERRHPKPQGYKTYTYAEVAQHCVPEDAWLIVEGKVYDVSAMQHPGGDVIFSYAGRDASELFNVMHKNQPHVRKVMKAYLIGEVAKPDRTALLQDFEAMTQRFTQQGLMDASGLFYARKLLELLALAGTSAWLNFSYPASLPVLLLSSVLMATFFYQCGWMQHDFNHNQVFRSHKLNALVGGWVISLGIGGSAHWWKTKHNQHHATPNKMDADDKHPVDPDIDTVPLIAWSDALLKQVSPRDRGIISVQHIAVWPLLCVALVNWQMQSLMHAASFPNIPKGYRRYELLLIFLHYAWNLTVSFLPLGLSRGLLFWVLSHALGGFVTAFVFIQSHNAMEIYTDDKDFVTSQMVSTRNIDPGLVTDWIFGGLNYQIEHHLYPTMPRHSFSRVRRDIMQFCAKHGLPYESVGIFESSAKVYRQLQHIAKKA